MIPQFFLPILIQFVKVLIQFVQIHSSIIEYTNLERRLCLVIIVTIGANCFNLVCPPFTKVTIKTIGEGNSGFSVLI